MAIVIDQAYILIWILEMFETPPERPTVVATHYGLSLCLVMFASETPAANKYPNRLLVRRTSKTHSSVIILLSCRLAEFECYPHLTPSVTVQLGES